MSCMSQIGVVIVVNLYNVCRGSGVYGGIVVCYSVVVVVVGWYNRYCYDIRYVV